MRILNICKLCLGYAGLGKEEAVTICGRSVPRSFIRFFIVSSQVFFVTMEVLVLRKNLTSGLNAILYPLHLMLLYAMKGCVYVVLVNKSGTIAELIDYMQDVIDERS